VKSIPAVKEVKTIIKKVTISNIANSVAGDFKKAEIVTQE
jgi:hypothetical protein